MGSSGSTCGNHKQRGKAKVKAHVLVLLHKDQRLVRVTRIERSQGKSLNTKMSEHLRKTYTLIKASVNKQNYNLWLENIMLGAMSMWKIPLKSVVNPFDANLDLGESLPKS
jgi:hypothetical protein